VIKKIQKRARLLADALRNIGDARMRIQLIEQTSKTGGGALPLMELRSLCVAIQIKGLSANSLEKRMRDNDPPIIGRIESDLFLMDLRTIQEDELSIIETALLKLTQKA
jgi:L-seryl-tRNA(Ser) seleniumtransferase